MPESAPDSKGERLTARAYGFLKGFGFFVWAKLFDPAARRPDVEEPPSLSGPERRRILLTHNQALVVSGWAIDLRSSQPAGGVTVEIDRAARLETDFGSRREDVANAFGNPNYADCEFTVVIPPVALPVGNHTISLLLQHPEDHGMDVAVTDALSVVVQPHSDR